MEADVRKEAQTFKLIQMSTQQYYYGIRNFQFYMSILFRQCVCLNKQDKIFEPASVSIFRL